MDSRKHRILVVDDNDEILDFLTLQLDMRGYRCLTSRRGRDALKMAQERLPDLVLLDIMLPDIDGFKVCRTLKDDPATSRIPVIFLTAKTTDVDKLKGFEVGAEDFLVKPFKIPELISKVQILLRLKGLVDSTEEKARRFKTLFDIGCLMSSSLDLGEVLSAVTRSVRDLLQSDSASIMLCEPDGRTLRVSCAEGPNAPFRDQTLPIDASVAGWVVRRSEPVIIDDIAHDPRFRSLPHRSQVRSALLCPLRHKDRTFGSINASFLSEERRITTDNLQLLVTLSSQAAMAIANARLVVGLKESYLSTITALARAVDARDTYTACHCENVARYAAEIALRLSLSAKDAEEVRVGGMLHDIGKIGIEDRILKKPGKLDEAEFAIMRMHPVKGHEILRHVELPESTLHAVLYHHEQVDGRGYPEGLSGEAIPLSARIVLVADAYDAMTTDRIYRKALPVEAAVDELQRFAGTQFDAGCVEAMCDVLKLARR